MLSSSSGDADQVLSSGNPLKGGGPLNPIASTYMGAGFRVDRLGFPPAFEFAALEGAAVCLLLVETFVFTGGGSAVLSASDFAGRPLFGLEAS